MNKYEPFTEEEYLSLEQYISTVKNHIDSNKAGYVWEACTRIRGTREKTPCTCASAGGHWSRCMETIRTFLNERNTDRE
jgi:hypothetical protein